MKFKLIIPALLAAALPLGAQGLREDAGSTFLEPLQKRDSVLIADQFRYGIVLENITEGTPLALPELKPEKYWMSRPTTPTAMAISAVFL